MNRSRLLPLAVLTLLALNTVAASASGIPSVANSTVPQLIRMVGSYGGVPDAAAGQFKVVARGFANNPINSCVIAIDFSACPDLVFCADQLDPDALTNCAARVVRKFTNTLGEVTFTLLGASTGAGNVSTLANSGNIFGNGVLMGRPSIASFDLDGMGGVGAGDLSVWLADFGSGVNWARSDYDGSGTVGAADLAEWLGVFGAGTSAQSCATSCP